MEDIAAALSLSFSRKLGSFYKLRQTVLECIHIAFGPVLEKVKFAFVLVLCTCLLSLPKMEISSVLTEEIQKTKTKLFSQRWIAGRTPKNDFFWSLSGFFYSAQFRVLFFGFRSLSPLYFSVRISLIYSFIRMVTVQVSSRIYEPGKVKDDTVSQSTRNKEGSPEVFSPKV